MKNSTVKPMLLAGLRVALRRCWLAAAALLLVLAAPALPAAERALDKEVLMAADVDAVWAAWTTREGIVSFFAPGAEVEARVGGAFHVFFDPLAAPGARSWTT